MEQAKVEELKNDLRNIASLQMEQVTELDELEKEIINQTINWTGEARKQKMDQEMELAEDENKREIDRLVKNFDEMLQAEAEEVGVVFIQEVTNIQEIRELARLLEISVSDMNNLLYDQARISNAELLINETDTFSKLVLRKMLVLGLLTGDMKKRVTRDARVNKDELIILKQLQTGRDFIVGQMEKRTPKELKQIALEQLLENELPK